jgi:hypothetical protein
VVIGGPPRLENQILIVTDFVRQYREQCRRWSFFDQHEEGYRTHRHNKTGIGRGFALPARKRPLLKMSMETKQPGGESQHAEHNRRYNRILAAAAGYAIGFKVGQSWGEPHPFFFTG